MKPKISNNLKPCRLKTDFTQVKLAEMAGITERYYQTLEYGEAEPKVTLAQRLARALGVEVSDIYPPHEYADDTTILSSH